jgi:fatty acid desaturase
MSVPITHREAIAAIPAAELARLKEPRDGPGLLRLLAHVGALAVTGAVIVSAPSPWLWLPALLVHGILLVFLFTLEHECIHETAFRTGWLNSALAEITGLAVLVPPRWFRYFHLAHHRHTQDPEHDPELASPPAQTLRAYLWRLTGIPLWAAQVRSIVMNALGREIGAYVPERGRAKVIAEARRALMIYATLAAAGVMFAWSWLLWLWVIPALVGQPFLRAYLMGEHTGLPFVPDMLINSRTTFTAPLVHWIAWNMPHHTAHHTLPTVPFHRLPELSALLRPHLKSTAPGYLAVHREIASKLRT